MEQNPTWDDDSDDSDDGTRFKFWDTRKGRQIDIMMHKSHSETEKDPSSPFAAARCHLLPHPQDLSPSVCPLARPSLGPSDRHRSLPPMISFTLSGPFTLSGRSSFSGDQTRTGDALSPDRGGGSLYCTPT